jgi:uncharacterized repeat protein (TIGR02543 family)
VQWAVTSGTASIASPSSNSTTVTLTAGNATVTASFAINTYTLSVINDGNGTVSPSGSVNVQHGVPTAISATAGTGSHLKAWRVISGTASISDSNNAAATVILTSGNAAIRAVFELDRYTLYVAKRGDGTTVPYGPVNVTHDVPFNVSATPAEGFAFTGWTVDSGSAAIANPILPATTITLSAGDAVVYADFTADTAFAPSSSLLSVTGQLADSLGNPVGAGSPELVDMTVRLATSLTAGDTVYTETFHASNSQAVEVDNGFFVFRLGAGASTGDLASTLSMYSNLYVEITIESPVQDVLTPRTPLTASAYSLGGASSRALTPAVLHGTGNPNNLDINGAVGMYFIDDSSGTTWLRVNSGWKIID